MTTTRRNYELRGEDAPDFSRYGLQSVKIGREPDARSTSQSRSKKIASAATLNLATLRASRNNALPGRVAERLKAPVLKFRIDFALNACKLKGNASGTRQIRHCFGILGRIGAELVRTGGRVV
jgi:hypothetical protein